MKTTLIDYVSKISEEYEKLESNIVPYASSLPDVEKHMNIIRNIYGEKVVKTKPQIMIYGIYNAGKSSIINSLIRENKAKVADVPTTDKVEYFKWNGYEIADTPGVGAPIEHEEVTNEQLRKADIVLFVMATGGSFEYRQNYKRMKDIIDAGKIVIIIINDKANRMNDEKALAEIRSKIVQNMKQVGIDYAIENINDKYKIVMVNARFALQALQINNEELFKYSHMPELERVIELELKNTSSFVVLKNAVTEMEREIKAIITEMEKAEDYTEMQDLNDMLDVIRNQRKNLRAEMKSYIDTKTKQMGAVLANDIWVIKEDEKKIKELVETRVNTVINQVQRKMELEYSEIIELVGEEAKKLIGKLQDIEIGKFDHQIKVTKTDSVDNNSIIGTDNKVKQQDRVQKLLEAAKMIHNIYNGGKGKVIEENLILYKPSDVNNDLKEKLAMSIIVQDLSKDVLTVAAKTMLGKTAGSMVGKFIPYIGPIITILSLFFSGDSKEEWIKAQNEAEQSRLQAEEQARQSLVQNVEYMAMDLNENLLASVNKQISNTFDAIESFFEEQLADVKTEASNLTSDINSIGRIDNNLNQIAFSLTV